MRSASRLFASKAASERAYAAAVPRGRRPRRATRSRRVDPSPSPARRPRPRADPPRPPRRRAGGRRRGCARPADGNDAAAAVLEPGIRAERGPGDGAAPEPGTQRCANVAPAAEHRPDVHAAGLRGEEPRVAREELPRVVHLIVRPERRVQGRVAAVGGEPQAMLGKAEPARRAVGENDRCGAGRRRATATRLELERPGCDRAHRDPGLEAGARGDGRRQEPGVGAHARFGRAVGRRRGPAGVKARSAGPLTSVPVRRGPLGRPTRATRAPRPRPGSGRRRRPSRAASARARRRRPARPLGRARGRQRPPRDPRRRS